MLYAGVMIVIMKKIKDFIEEVKETIDWIIAGCPEPVPIPVKPKDGRDVRKKLQYKDR